MITRPTFPSGVDRGILVCSTGGSSRQSHTLKGSQLKRLDDGHPDEPRAEDLTNGGLENIYKKKAKRHTPSKKK